MPAIPIPGRWLDRSHTPAPWPGAGGAVSAHAPAGASQWGASTGGGTRCIAGVGFKARRGEAVLRDRFRGNPTCSTITL